MRGPLVAAAFLVTLLGACNRIENLPPRQGGSGEELVVVKRGLTASSHGFRFLGILPLVFPSQDEAEKLILSQAGVDPHAPDYVLINMVRQTNSVYFFIASVHTLTLTADLAHIEKPTPKPAS